MIVGVGKKEDGYQRPRETENVDDAHCVWSHDVWKGNAGLEKNMRLNVQNFRT